MSVVTAVRLLRQPDVAVFDAAVKRGQNSRRFRVKAFSLIFFQSMCGRLKFELVISGHGFVDFVDCVFTADFFPFGIQSARQFPYLPLNDQTVAAVMFFGNDVFDFVFANQTLIEQIDVSIAKRKLFQQIVAFESESPAVKHVYVAFSFLSLDLFRFRRGCRKYAADLRIRIFLGQGFPQPADFVVGE